MTRVRIACASGLLAALALAACGAPAEKGAEYVNFDAVCSLDDPPGEAVRYSIDLDRKTWCVTDRCAPTRRSIVSTNRNAIVLVAGAEGSLKLDRASGALTGQYGSQRISGVCTRSVFTATG